MILTIKGYAPYTVSDAGEVFNKDGKPKKLYRSGIGYQQVTLYKNGEPKLMMVHRLVATRFVPNPFHKPHVNHKNGEKADNRAENLEWCTREENMRHSVDVIGNKPWNKGKRGIYSAEARKKMSDGRKGKAPWNKRDALAKGKTIEEFIATL